MVREINALTSRKRRHSREGVLVSGEFLGEGEKCFVLKDLWPSRSIETWFWQRHLSLDGACSPVHTVHEAVDKNQ